MIAHLQGKLVEKSATQVVIDCGGVGYEVNISLHTYSLLPATDFVKLFIHLQIKEDSHTLFGFVEMKKHPMLDLRLKSADALLKPSLINGWKKKIRY